jgi:serine protease AprX
MAAIEWAVDQAARVINVSLGGGPYPADGSDALSAMCNAAADQGVVVCVAAGNLGPARQSIGSPAAAARAITVGAADIRQPLSESVVADFSSRGPTGDGRAKPDVLFPGRGIIAPRAEGTALGQPVGERYTRLNGTSQATPMATGTAAMLLQANPRLSPDEVKARMMRGARRLSDAPANAQGSGLGDAYNTFVSSAGSPLDGEDSAPGAPEPGEQPPVRQPEPGGCRPAILSGGRSS